NVSGEQPIFPAIDSIAPCDAWYSSYSRTGRIARSRISGVNFVGRSMAPSLDTRGMLESTPAASSTFPTISSDRGTDHGERNRSLVDSPSGQLDSPGAPTSAGSAGTMSCGKNVVRLQEGRRSAEVPAPGKHAWHADGPKREELSGQSQGEVRRWCRSSEGLL